MATWINFKELRAKLHFKNILDHYRVETKVKGDRATALCPLPGHPSRTDGAPRTASLSVNLTRNIFQCFGCEASGNALEFCCRMEGFDPGDSQQFRIGAIKVAELFGIDAGKGVDGSHQSNDATPDRVHRLVVNTVIKTLSTPSFYWWGQVRNRMSGACSRYRSTFEAGFLSDGSRTPFCVIDQLKRRVRISRYRLAVFGASPRLAT
jgi:hypothetical protein